MKHSIPSIVVLISGRGSNLKALIESSIKTQLYKIGAVVSNRPDAKGLELARQSGLATAVLDHQQFADRKVFDLELAKLIDSFEPNWVVLAGFMRVLSEGFVNHYANRLLNIHPSLLPAFPGLRTHEQALAAGVRVHGATVHVVTPALDHGPILDQAVVQVMPDDTAASLAERVLALEHVLYPRVLERLMSGEIQIQHGMCTGTLKASLLNSIQ